MRLGAGERRDPLDEVEDRFRRAAFFLQHRGDDLLGLGAREAALAQEALAIVVLASDDLFASGPDPGKKRCGRCRGEAFQRRRRLMRKAVAGDLAVADRDLLDRKSVVEGMRLSVSVDLGCSLIIKKKK